MATIVILQHALYRHYENKYMVHGFAERWRATGHTVIEHFGVENPPEGDIAVLHVDLTVTPAEYQSLVPRYPRVINGTIFDISKHTFSQNLVTRGDGWDGPVVVKTDANYYGRPEGVAHMIKNKHGDPDEIVDGPLLTEYPIYSAPDKVPEEFWTIPGIIVEKFLPERDERGFYMRAWTFFGDRERSSRFLSNVAIIKSADIIERETVAVPDEIRAWRARLGFDFGKFDYVVHEGRPILLDTNRTPGMPTSAAVLEGASADYRSMADGISVFLP